MARGYDGRVELGTALVVASGVALLATVFALRNRRPARVIDMLFAVEGAALASGGLLLVDDVGAASWLAAPLVMAVTAPLHVRVLFAGEGPLRT